MSACLKKPVNKKNITYYRDEQYIVQFTNDDKIKQRKEIKNNEEVKRNYVNLCIKEAQ